MMLVHPIVFRHNEKPDSSVIIQMMQQISGLNVELVDGIIVIRNMKYKFTEVEILNESSNESINALLKRGNVLVVSYISKRFYYLKALLFYVLYLLGADIEKGKLPQWVGNKWENIPFWRKNSFFI